MDWRKRYQKAVTFSYDDGNEQDLQLLEIFNRYGMKATFHVNTGLDWNHGTWCYRNTLEVRRLNLTDDFHVYQGHEIAMHGRLHRNLTELTPAQRQEELESDRDAITKIFGVRPAGMSYAYGAYDAETIALLRRMGIRYARTTKSTYSFSEQTDLLQFCPTCHHDDCQLFSLAEQFLQGKPDAPWIFCIWGHSYELEGNQNWNRMEQLCEMLSGKEDIFYGTNREVLL